MSAVGIKRVFWTNGKGEWKGAKVRDLVDALEGGENCSGEEEGGNVKGSVAGNGVFVTKHEVLKLRGMLAERVSR